MLGIVLWTVASLFVRLSSCIDLITVRFRLVRGFTSATKRDGVCRSCALSNGFAATRYERKLDVSWFGSSRCIGRVVNLLCD